MARSQEARSQSAALETAIDLDSTSEKICDADIDLTLRSHQDYTMMALIMCAARDLARRRL